MFGELHNGKQNLCRKERSLVRKTRRLLFALFGFTKRRKRTYWYMGTANKRYLKKNHRALYINLLTSGKLNNFLAGIDKQATDMYFRLVNQLAEQEKVTEA